MEAFRQGQHHQECRKQNDYAEPSLQSLRRAQGYGMRDSISPQTPHR